MEAPQARNHIRSTMLPQGFTKSKGYAQGGWRGLKLCEENVKDLYQSFTKWRMK